MIHRFSVSNFYSIDNNVTVDFTVDNKATRTGGFIETPSGTRVSIIEAVFGPNASGKTTTLKALAFIKWVIVDAYRADRRVLPFDPFVASDKKDQPTELEVVFELDGEIYVYAFALTKKRILREELRERSKSKVKTTHKKLFSRVWNEKLQSYDVVDRGFGMPWDYVGVRAKELGNSSLIGAARRFGHERSKAIANYWDQLKTNIDIEDSWTPPYQYGAMQALMFYERDKKAKVKAEAIIRRYDLGIDSFDKDGYINHSFNGKKYKLRFDVESSGTQQLLTLTQMIDAVLQNGGVAVIDEFGAYLHPVMFRELIEQFNNPKLNKKHAQLFLSTHSVGILEELKKYQILLAEKHNGATSVARLDALQKGVRNDENYRIKYLAGKYGAVPKLDKVTTNK